jgi:aminoglycoside 6'-N-acetyltransferase I
MTKPQFRVRPLQESDLAEWFRLRKLLWDASDDDEHKAEMLDIFEHTDTQLVLIAELDNGRLIGFLEASIRPFVEDCRTDRVGYLEGWYVEPEFRRFGIGSNLVAQAEIWARGQGCTEMASDAEVGDEASVKLHEQMGYKESSRLIHLRKDI